MNEPTAQISSAAIEASEQPRVQRELTHHIRLVLDNDEALYDGRREIVRAHLAVRDPCPFCDGTGEALIGCKHNCEHCNGASDHPRHPRQLGDQLKEWCEDLVGLQSVGEENAWESRLLTCEILSTALAWVAWVELAEDFIEEAKEGA